MNNHFEKNIQQQLDVSVTTLDAMTQSQLTQARYNALAHGGKTRNNLGRWVTGFASAAILGLLVITVMPTLQTQDSQQLAAISSGALLVSDMDDIDLYQNLEFYQWLEDSNG